jgi:hypothetical protein
MGWNGSGTFTRVRNWQDDANAGINIVADLHDEEDDNLTSGINACLTKNGQNAATAHLPMGGFRHTDVADATQPNHYASAGQVQDGSVIWGGTAGGTADALTLSVTPTPSSYVAGMVIRFIGSASNTGTATINVNGMGAKTAKSVTGKALPGGYIKSGNIYEAIYDGTDFRLLQFGDVLVGGYSTATHDLGTITGGTVTPDVSNGHKQKLVNNGAFTLAPPTTDTDMQLKITNASSAGIITVSGFDLQLGDDFTTTNTHKFLCQIITIDGDQILNVKAFQ